LDPQVLNKETAIVGGGDVNKLLEVGTKDIVAILRPIIVDISEN
jgi:prolyl-tRNA editing enzyme YbaK/EbsC (Cys-tRNA(Pro) deacylase)